LKFSQTFSHLSPTAVSNRYGSLKEGLIETKRLIVDGVDILKKVNELSVKVESQQKQIDELKKTIDGRK